MDEGEPDPEDVHYASESEENLLETFLFEGDEDALVVLQWEDKELDTSQRDHEMVACLSTCLDARRRVSDNAKNRGFWLAKGRARETSGATRPGVRMPGMRQKGPLAARVPPQQGRADNTLPIA